MRKRMKITDIFRGFDFIVQFPETCDCSCTSNSNNDNRVIKFVCCDFIWNCSCDFSINILPV